MLPVCASAAHPVSLGLGLGQEAPAWLEHVLRHAGAQAVANATQVCRSWRTLTLDSKRLWRAMAEDLGDQAHLYVVDESAAEDSAEAWRDAFKSLWARRRTFAATQKEEGGEKMMESDFDDGEEATTQLRFGVDVCVRLRPPAALVEAAAARSNGRSTVLPLHQRIALVKANNPNVGSTSDALKLVVREMGRVVADPWAMPKVREEQTVQDVDENGAGREDDSASGKDALPELKVGVVSHDDTSVLAAMPGVGLRTFQFHRVFAPGAVQGDVYSASARRCVADALNGVSGCVLVYGFTGSGKTTTVFGVHQDARREARGIVPRACEELYDASKMRAMRHAISCDFELAYVEVYGNSVIDLITGKPVGQNAALGQRYVLEGAANHAAPSLSEMRRLLAVGDAKKRQAATAMNERSSRAHTLVTITLRQSRRDQNSSPPVVSRLFFADLGGAENLNKSKANAAMAAIPSAGSNNGTWQDYYASRTRVDEAIAINSGLFALKNCIDLLMKRTKAAAEGLPLPYVPYQDSRLTMLLSGALNGGSRTSVVVCASPEAPHASETLQALRFGERCGGIETSATLASSALRAALERLDAEIDATKKLIEERELWVTQREQREDIDGVEWVTVSKLVGAEKKHDKLEELANRRRELVGVSC